MRPSNLPSAKSFDYERMVWGAHEVRMSPMSLGAMTLRYALSDLKRVDGKILEVGCGAGSMARAIKAYRSDLELSGCDLSFRAVREAMKRSALVQVSRADAMSLPFRSGAFRAVLLFDVLEHLPQPELAISEAARVLEPSGLLHISVPMEGRVWTVQGLLRRLGWRGFECTVGHIQAFDITPLRRLLANHGLRTTRVRWSGHLISQVAHTGYVLWLSMTDGGRVSMSVESQLGQSSRGSVNKVVGILKDAVAILSYLESTVLNRTAGATAHITAIK